MNNENDESALKNILTKPKSKEDDESSVYEELDKEDEDYECDSDIDVDLEDEEYESSYDTDDEEFNAQKDNEMLHATKRIKKPLKTTIPSEKHLKNLKQAEKLKIEGYEKMKPSSLQRNIYAYKNYKKNLITALELGIEGYEKMKPLSLENNISFYKNYDKNLKKANQLDIEGYKTMNPSSLQRAIHKADLSNSAKHNNSTKLRVESNKEANLLFLQENNISLPKKITPASLQKAKSRFNLLQRYKKEAEDFGIKTKHDNGKDFSDILLQKLILKLQKLPKEVIDDVKRYKINILLDPVGQKSNPSIMSKNSIQKLIENAKQNEIVKKEEFDCVNNPLAKSEDINNVDNATISKEVKHEDTNYTQNQTSLNKTNFLPQHCFLPLVVFPQGFQPSIFQPVPMGLNFGVVPYNLLYGTTTYGVAAPQQQPQQGSQPTQGRLGGDFVTNKQEESRAVDRLSGSKDKKFLDGKKSLP